MIPTTFVFMALWKKPKRCDQWVEQFSEAIRHLVATLIHRAGQFVRRNSVASAAAGLLLITLLGAIANTWFVQRAQVANARVAPSSNDVRQLAHLRRVGYYDTLDNLTSSARMKDGLTSDVHNPVNVHNSPGSAMEGDRDIPLKNQSTVPRTYEELVADNPKDRTYYRNLSMTYVNPGGGVLNLANVDPAALGPYAGDYLVLINKPQAALEAFRQRLTIDEQAVAADPGNLQVQTDLAYSASRIGDLLAEMGDHAGALPYYQRAVDIYTKNVFANPGHFAIPQFAQLLGKLAKTHARLGYNEKASSECSKALDLLAVTDDTANVEQRRVTASAYSEIGDTYSLIARDTRTPEQFMPKLWTAAREVYERSLAILIDLRERGVLNADDLTEVDNISHKIAECDLFLAM